MADDSDLEKTEAASQQRLTKAREEGDVPRSRELATFTVLMAAVAGFWLWGGAILGQLRHLLSYGLSFQREQVMDPAQLGSGLARQLFELFMVFVPLIGLTVLTALLSPALIGGWLFSAKALGPNFGKLNPINGLSQMVSLHALTELFKALGKTALVSAAAYFVIASQLDSVFGLGLQDPALGMAHQGHLLLQCFAALVASLALIALIDAPYQMWSYSKKLMMTRQEVRQEAKESDGNPEIKAKIRAQQREMARRRMMAEVPTADVVLTNPTHYAVALKYPPDSHLAPTVVAKGVNEVAAKIREIAQLHRIMIIEAAPLARALHRHTELQQEIPAPLYAAVAQLLAYVFQLRSWRSEGGLAPEQPSPMTLPQGFDPHETAVASVGRLNTLGTGV